MNEPPPPSPPDEDAIAREAFRLLLNDGEMDGPDDDVNEGEASRRAG